MREHAAELWRWLQDGAHFYVCGDASRMAKDVDTALREIAAEQGGLNEAQSKDWMVVARQAGPLPAGRLLMARRPPPSESPHLPGLEPGDRPAIRTTCPYCGVGCGVLATPTAPSPPSIAGDPAHPANSGRLCVKGTALGETLSLTSRLLHPEMDGVRASGTRRWTGWPTRSATPSPSTGRTAWRCTCPASC